MIRRSKAHYRLCRVTVVALIAMLCVVSLAGATPGSLDPTFGGDGVVTTAIGRANDYAYTVAVQADGKIIVAGSAEGEARDHFALARFNTDGSLDTSFDYDGRVTTDIGTSMAKVSALAVQTDGKIVAAGSAFIGNIHVALARYNADGSLDATFGTGGKVILEPGVGDFAYAVVVQADGKMLVAGLATAGSNWEFLLMRLNADGSLDTAFDGDGIVTTDMSVGVDQISAMTIQADGKIVVAGQAWGDWYDFALVRYNADGSLDTTFDGDGKLLTRIGSSHDRAYAVAVQTDGKIVAAGHSSNGSNYDFALVRYNADGALDTSFDGDGKVTTAFGSGDDSAAAMTVVAGGKLLVAGYAFNGSNTDFALARYNTDGALDASFGSGGKVTTAIGSGDDSATAMAVQTDGRIVAAGNTWNGGSTLRDVALARYSADGGLDSTFDGDGVLSATFRGGDDYGYAVVLQPDNKIVVAGSAETGGQNGFALARYDAGGALDPSFGASGLVTAAVATSAAAAYAVALQADGKIVAAGFAWINSGRVFTLARYNADGALDTSFGANGVVTTTFSTSSSYAYAVAVQADGKIVAAGSVSDGSTYDFALARYNADGTPDDSFGSGGKVTTAISTRSDEIYALALQADGRIVAAGYTSGIGSSYFALARYNSDGSLDAAFDGDGVVTTDFGSNTHQINGVAVQADGKIVAAGRMYNLSNRDYDFAVARYNTDGTLDTSFDGDGRVTTGWGAGHEYAYAVAVQADGKILVAGSDDGDFVVGRYNADGALDASFGSAGRAAADIRGSDDSGRAMAIQGDGKIVVAGYAHNGGNYDFALARFESEVNHPPTAAAGGPYTVAEGGSVTLDGTASSDPDPGDTLTFAWDLDNDGIFGESGADAGRGDEAGVAPTFSATGLNGPDVATIHLRVTDPGGLSATDTTTVTITDVPTPPPGLVLWNKLGSPDEVLNSEVGADFTISSEPEVLFFPGKYGGSFGTTGGAWGYGGYLYMSPDSFFAPDKAQGTVEMWLQKRIPSFVPFQTPVVGIFGLQNYNCVPWVDPCDRDDYAPISAYWSDGYTGGGGLNFELVDADNTWHQVNDVGWNDPVIVPMYEWRHVAFVWDLGGIGGTSDTMRIYRDGVVVGSSTDAITSLMDDSGVVKLLGHHAYDRYNQPTIYMDDIKVWDYAKFVEGENRPPTAEAGGEYTVSEGGSVTLDGTASSDPDPSDTLTYAWDLDNDGIYGETGADAARGDETGPTPTLSAAGLNGPGSYTVSLRVADRAGANATDTARVYVMNVGPTVEAPTVRPEPSVEGEAVIAEAVYTDPGNGESYSCTVNYGDGDGEQRGSVHEDVCTGPAHTYLGGGTYTVEIVVRDQEGGWGSNSTRHRVNASGELQLGIGVEPQRNDWAGIQQSMQKVSELRFHRALYYVNWSETQPAPYVLNWFELDTVVEQARAAGVQPVFRIYQTPPWARPESDVHAPAKKEDLAQFVAILVARYGTKVGGYVIWNEPNLPVGWENAEIDAAAYIDMLRSAYQAAKSINPNVVIVSAGLAPTQGGDGAVNDLTFLRQMVVAGLSEVADVIGMNGLGFASSPDDRSDPNGYNFSRLEQLRQIMVDNGGVAKPAWALEVGWVADVPGDLGGFNWWKVSETRQAQYLRRAIQKVAVEWPWLDGLFIWNLNFRHHAPQPEKDAFAIQDRLAFACVSQSQPAPPICDALPPSISLIRESADPINQMGCSIPTTVTISAEVIGVSGVAWVRLNYQPPQGNWRQVEMLRGQTNSFAATIGPFDLPGVLNYTIQAQDGEGHAEQSVQGTVTVNGCAEYCVDLALQGFDPAVDGLKFQNFFPRDSGGVNVGMSLAAIDYFNAVTATLPITYNRWEGPRTWNPTNLLQAYVIWRHHNNQSAVFRYELASQTAQPLKEQRNALEFDLVRRAIAQDNAPVVLGLIDESWLQNRHTVVAYSIHDCPARNEFWINVHDSNATAEGHVGLGRIFLSRTTGAPAPGIAVTPYDSEGYDQLYALSPQAIHATDPATAYGGGAAQQHAVLHSQTVAAMQEQGLSIQDTYGGGLNPGAASELYTVTAHAGSSFAVMVNWGGSILKLSIYKPDGTLFWEKRSAVPPLTAPIADAQAGAWTFRVTAVDVPAEDYPYVVAVGVKERNILYLPLVLRH